MKLRMLGCSHHDTVLEVREQVAFSPEQVREALERLKHQYPDCELVLLSTCNRVELYVGSLETEVVPSGSELVAFLADFHRVQSRLIQETFRMREDDAAVMHLFSVASSIDSLVVGESQISSQVSAAYETSRSGG